MAGINQLPEYREVMDSMPYERAPYIIGQIALSVGDSSAVLDALRELDRVNLDGNLRPPIPSVWASKVNRTVNTADKLGVTPEPAMSIALLATVLDFGNVRYATDPAANEGRS